MSREHRWNFFRAGGVDQVVLQEGADIANLADLDLKLWVALACPVKNLALDERTLSMLDMDSDGRIRAPEIIAAATWCKAVFKSLDVLFTEGATLSLQQINGETEAGHAVLTGAKRVLEDASSKKASKVGLLDVERSVAALAQRPFNGDGVVPAESAPDEALRSVIAEIVDTVGSAADRCGKPGVDRGLADVFFAEVAAYVAWEDGRSASADPLGAATGAAADAHDAVRDKVIDYFTRCRVAAFDARAAVALAPAEAALVALSVKALTTSDEDLERLPIARAESGRALLLEGGINPAWTARVTVWREAVVRPLLGAQAAVSEADFQGIEGKLADARAWRAACPPTKVAKLGSARLREILASDARKRIDELLDEDLRAVSDVAAIELCEKAVRLRRDFVKILKNFVNFAEFYGKREASFQAGRLYLDARSCDLCVHVQDVAKHAALAGLSRAYLAYCECTRQGEEKMSIVAAFTAGDIDNLMVGRNGVFYDRQGRDWDATITSIVENPISVRQAFWQPYKRLVRLVEEQVAKRAAEKEKKSTASMDQAAVSAAAADQHGAPPPPAAAPPAAPPPAPAPAPGAPPAAPAPPPPIAPKKFDVGTIAAIGVAIAGVATFFSSILATFLGLGMWMPLGLLALLLAISGPAMVIAWLKLRQRNLGPLLDANGWAVNGQMRINVPFGGALTKVAKLPEGASRSLDDPFAEKKTPWGLYVALTILLVALVVAGLGAAKIWVVWEVVPRWFGR